ncbi:MAG TPA: SEC-C metal-binding domain-containing protein [Acidimicrobiales bacterium]|nr:SEC-C metal-binding domain-containing protein [Acidimicrobiales bacterium]
MGRGGARHAVEWVRTRNPVAAGAPWMRSHSWRMYALSLGDRWLQAPRRFVIVTAGRSGSELLTDLLNSHPDIVCDAEILHDRVALPERFVAGRAAKAGIGGAEAYGFKIHNGHFGFQVLRERPGYLGRLSDDGFHLIFLRRRNLLAQAVSSTIASRTRWHWRRDDGASFAALDLDPVEVLMMAYLFEESDGYLERLLRDLPHTTLVYEDDLRDRPAQQATVDRIASVLGLAAAPVASDHVRFTPPKLSESIANFAAVAELVRPTRFARFLDDDADDDSPGGADRVGRNQSCPCGSGKEYEFCHGA